MGRSRTEYSFLNIVAGIGGYFLNTIMGFICRIIFTRCLAEEYLGISGLFTNILTMLSLAELGIGSAIVYALYKPLAENDQPKIRALVQFYRKAYMVIGVVVALIGLAMLPFLNFIIQDAPQIKENLHVIYLLYLFNSVFSYFFSYRASLLQAAQKNYLVIGINYLVTIMQSILQIIVLLLTSNYMLYLVIQIIGGISYNIIISSVARQQYPYIIERGEPLEKREVRAISKNVSYLVVNKLANLLLSNTNNIITTYFGGLSITGLVSNYSLFVTTINSLLSQIFNSFTASIGNFNVTESDDRKLFLFNSINLSNFWFFGWASIGIFCCSSDLVRWFYGEKYVLDISIPFILAVNFYVVGLMNAVWSFKSAFGLFKYGRYILILTSIINVSLAIGLGKVLGVFGIFAANSISRLLTNAWYEPYALFKYGLHKSPLIYIKKYLEYTVLIIITGGLCYFICRDMSFGIVLNPILKIVICTIIPNSLFYLHFRKKTEFKMLKDRVIAMLKIVCNIIFGSK